ncbi:tetratricopeptide repeat protein, partial [Acinetobacter baumannii]
RGLSKEKLGDHNGALSDLEKALKISQANPNIYFNRAIIRRDLKQYKLALEDFDKALVLSPTNSDLFLNRGITKIYAG